MVNGEEGGSLIRNENQEAAADVRLGNNNHKIDIMFHHTTSSRSTRSRVKKVILLLFCFKPIVTFTCKY